LTHQLFLLSSSRFVKKTSFFPDRDYQGPLSVCLRNYGEETVELKAGRCYAQLIPLRYYNGPVLGACDFFFRTDRGEGGFGSTEVRLEAETQLRAAEEEGEHVAVSCVETVLRPDSVGV
jgi:hypothetical protein